MGWTEICRELGWIKGAHKETPNTTTRPRSSALKLAENSLVILKLMGCFEVTLAYF